MDEIEKNKFKLEKLRKKHMHELDNAIENLSEILSMSDKELEEQRLEALKHQAKSDLTTSKTES